MTLNGIAKIVSRKFSHTRQGWIMDSTTSWKFYLKIFILERNHESFLPRKLGAIRYLKLLAILRNSNIMQIVSNSAIEHNVQWICPTNLAFIQLYTENGLITAWNVPLFWDLCVCVCVCVCVYMCVCIVSSCIVCTCMCMLRVCVCMWVCPCVRACDWLIVAMLRVAVNVMCVTDCDHALCRSYNQCNVCNWLWPWLVRVLQSV